MLLYPDCISTKLNVSIGGYYTKLKQPFSSENQYKISGWLWNTSLYLVKDFCLQVRLLQFFSSQKKTCGILLFETNIKFQSNR